MSEVPVIVLAHLSDTERRALVIADNRLALSAGWDEEMLALELAALRDEEFSLDVLGFDEQELALLLADQDLTEGLTVGQDMKDLLGKSIQADMLNAQYAYLNGLEPKPVTDRFHVEITGWVSPTLDRKIRADALSFWQELAKDVTAASCAHRIATGDRTAYGDPACNR